MTVIAANNGMRRIEMQQIELPDKTLITEEMGDFVQGGPFTVGRDYMGRVAHIYTMNMGRSLCGRHVRSRAMRLRVYFAGNPTCKECLRRYRASKSNDERREAGLFRINVVGRLT